MKTMKKDCKQVTFQRDKKQGGKEKNQDVVRL